MMVWNVEFVDGWMDGELEDRIDHERRVMCKEVGNNYLLSMMAGEEVR